MTFAQAMTTLKENIKVFYGDLQDKAEMDQLTPPGGSFADWKKDVEATIRRGRTTKVEYTVLKLKFPDLKPVDPPEGREKKDGDKPIDICKTALHIKKKFKHHGDWEGDIHPCVRKIWEAMVPPEKRKD